MIKTDREGLARLKGLPPPAPAPAPKPEPEAAPAPPAATISPKVEEALLTLARQVQDVATIAARAQQSVVELANRSADTLEADIQRDHNGKMTRVVITRKNNKGNPA